MKKQLILGLCALSVASCGGLNQSNRNYSTLADMFVWGDNYEETPQSTIVSYGTMAPLQVKEVEDSDHKSYRYNDDVEVKYVEVEHKDKVEEVPTDIEVREIAVDEEQVSEQTYTLTKRAERYKNVNETFSPEVYAILASRVVNKFLADVPGILAETSEPSLYIEDTESADRYMPAGADVTANTVKEVLLGSKMMLLASDAESASHVLKGRLTNINTPEIPVFQYSLSLYDNNNRLIDEWTDTIRQVQNDDGSWW